MRPRSIQLFEKVYLGGMVLSLVIAAIDWNKVAATIDTPEAKSLGLGPGFLIGTLLFNVIASLVLWYFIARRASNAAKWIYIAFSAIGVFFIISSFTDPLVAKGLMLAGNVIALLLQLYTVWLLFRPDAVAWLESKGTNGPGDPTVFH